ncbi:hypothetical protein [Thomasclavelia saccharogumia]|uniref:hypothetical protein n=1 Tax=Thomasclavelia saccharogumia TaxID=341225 RepID=UPI00047EC7FE|nr:hypothetical protein [Thomasclavelia saccharogumia]
MKERLKKIIIDFNSNKINRNILIWYICSFGLVFLYCLINHKLDFRVYFHPLISIFINILLIINLLILPSIFIIIDILKEERSIIKIILKIIITGTGFSIITIIILFSFSIFNKAIFNIDTTKIEFNNDKIYVEYRVWLESSNHVDVYETDKIFFVRKVNSYKL